MIADLNMQQNKSFQAIPNNGSMVKETERSLEQGDDNVLLL